MPTDKTPEELVAHQVRMCSLEDRVAGWREAALACGRQLLALVPEGGTVVDIGCGAGLGFKPLSDAGHPPLRLIGVEVAAEKAAIARELNAGALILQMDAHTLELPHNSVDVAYSRHAFEHLYDPGKVLRMLSKALKPDGKLFLIVPFPDHVDECHVSCEIMGTTSDDPTRFFQFLADNGFDVQSHEKTSDALGAEIRVIATPRKTG